MIGAVVDHEWYANIMDEKGHEVGRLLLTKTCRIVGYTGNTVSVDHGNYITIHNEKGTEIGRTLK